MFDTELPEVQPAIATKPVNSRAPPMLQAEGDSCEIAIFFTLSTEILTHFFLLKR
jgi:hypothetical protein